MEQLKSVPVSDAHLLCLMEEWFDRTQPVVKALADFEYTTHDDRRLECPFCRKRYVPKSAARIVAGDARFRHKPNCLVLEARRLRSDMLADVDSESRADADGEPEEDGESLDGGGQERPATRNVFQLFQL